MASSIATAQARAQGMEGGYVPAGAGTFVPFRGGALGVMPAGPLGPIEMPTSPSRPMGIAPGPAMPGAREGIAPLRPIGIGRGMGTSSLIVRPPAVRPTPRAAVGSYPFRIPPSLVAPARASAGAM